MSTTALPTTAARSRGGHLPLSPLGRLTAGALLALAPIWTAFQVVEIGLFPPIGTIYALGSLVCAGVARTGRRWSLAPAVLWGLFMLALEASPTIEHLTDPSGIHDGHFVHYLLICAFLPLVGIIVAGGIGATVQNYRRAPADRPAPRWLGGALLATAALSLVAVTAVLLEFYR